jgi:predicted ATP-grasp superfamily ATP-dependent carboligase
MTETRRRHVLIVGVTTRAMVVSAARAGYRVTAIDAFGDTDLRAVASVITPPEGSRFQPMSAAMAAEAVPATAVAYTSNLENFPAAVQQLSGTRTLLGNSPAVLSRVRNPLTLMSVLRKHGFLTPRTRTTTPSDLRTRWMLKPRKSGGGHNVQIWVSGTGVPRSTYLQERIVGTPGSVVFASNGSSAVVLGVSRQLVGDHRFGTRGFRYCGSLLAGGRDAVFSHQSTLIETATRMAGVVASEFGLVGLNGIDFIARNGVPFPLEVNPRFSASMELVERSRGLSMFQVHVRACAGELPPELDPCSAVEGKAIVFARRQVRLGNTDSWSQNRAFADVPEPGTLFAAGNPMCTVFARAPDSATCLRRLVRQAGVVYRHVKVSTGRAA